jgi:hypothetical protein
MFQLLLFLMAKTARTRFRSEFINTLEIRSR